MSCVGVCRRFVMRVFLVCLRIFCLDLSGLFHSATLRVSHQRVCKNVGVRTRHRGFNRACLSSSSNRTRVHAGTRVCGDLVGFARRGQFLAALVCCLVDVRTNTRLSLSWRAIHPLLRSEQDKGELKEEDGGSGCRVSGRELLGCLVPDSRRTSDDAVF